MEPNVPVILATIYQVWGFVQFALKKLAYSVIQLLFAQIVIILLITWMALSVHKFVEMESCLTWNVMMETLWMVTDVHPIARLKMITHVAEVHQLLLQVAHFQEQLK